MTQNTPSRKDNAKKCCRVGIQCLLHGISSRTKKITNKWRTIFWVKLNIMTSSEHTQAHSRMRRLPVFWNRSMTSSRSTRISFRWTDMSARPERRSCPIVERKYVFMRSGGAHQHDRVQKEEIILSISICPKRFRLTQWASSVEWGKNVQSPLFQASMFSSASASKTYARPKRC